MERCERRQCLAGRVGHVLHHILACQRAIVRGKGVHQTAMQSDDRRPITVRLSIDLDVGLEGLDQRFEEVGSSLAARAIPDQAMDGDVQRNII